jgi:hypothetical protein
MNWGSNRHIKDKINTVDEAKIFKCGIDETIGPVQTVSEEKIKYLLEHFNCPTTDPIVRKQYEDLILKKHQAFTASKQDIGVSEEISHKIHMKTEQPVYVKQFRIPDIHEKEIVNHLNEWKKNNLREEHSSPNNRPIFCVPKKMGH